MTGELVAFVVIAIVVTAFGLWFGMARIAPRIGRAIDRVEPNDKEPGDRPA